MKFVIPCSAKKRKRYWTFEGRQVIFVAHPNLCSGSDSHVFFRPDDSVPYSAQTWRQKLLAYNQRGANPDDLCRAADLYAREIYRELADRFGWANTFILSAGWGLIRADFLLPYYDITFSRQADICNRRGKNDKYNDFNHFLDWASVGRGETIVFCGGNDYLPLYYELTQNIPARKVIYHKAKRPPRKPGYVYIEYDTTKRMWYYCCAKDFVHGKLEL